MTGSAMGPGREPTGTVFASATAQDVRLRVASCELLRAPMHRGPDGVLVAPDRLTVTYSPRGPVEVELVGPVIDPARLVPAWPGDRRAGYRMSAADAPWWAEPFIDGHRPCSATRPGAAAADLDELACLATAAPASS